MFPQISLAFNQPFFSFILDLSLPTISYILFSKFQNLLKWNKIQNLLNGIFLSHWKLSFGLVFADKSEADADRERALMDQWVCLTEERNAVMVPSREVVSLVHLPIGMYWKFSIFVDKATLKNKYSLKPVCVKNL